MSFSKLINAHYAEAKQCRQERYIRAACLATTGEVQRTLLMALWCGSPYEALGAAFPGKDYPPSKFASWIKACKAKGREDLGKKIMDAWNSVWERYPATRVNWATAHTIGENSIKKHVFQGMDFQVWFEQIANTAFTPEETKELRQAKDTLPPNTPAIAIPKANETFEDWSAAAKRVEEELKNLESTFANSDEFLAHIQKQMDDIERKISTYGQGGPEHLTSKGVPGKMSFRIPKWEEEKKVYVAKFSDVKKKMENAEKNFKTGKDAYHTAPITTVAFEGKVLERIAQISIQLKSLEAEKTALLEEMKNLMAQLGGEAKASVKITAVLGLDKVYAKITTLFQKAWKMLETWGDQVLEASHQFLDLVTLRTV